MSKKWTIREVKHIADRPHLSPATLAADFGVTPESIRKLRSRYNLESEDFFVVKLPKEKLPELKQMVDEGLPYKEIAKHFNMSAAYLGGVIRKHFGYRNTTKTRSSEYFDWNYCNNQII